MFNFLKKKKPEQMPQVLLMNCVKSCGKEKCPIWVVNYSDGQDGKKVADARCGFAWLPVLLIEIRQSIDRLKGSDEEKTNGDNK